MGERKSEVLGVVASSCFQKPPSSLVLSPPGLQLAGRVLVVPISTLVTSVFSLALTNSEMRHRFAGGWMLGSTSSSILRRRLRFASAALGLLASGTVTSPVSLALACLCKGKWKSEMRRRFEGGSLLVDSSTGAFSLSRRRLRLVSGVSDLPASRFFTSPFARVQWVQVKVSSLLSAM